MGKAIISKLFNTKKIAKKKVKFWNSFLLGLAISSLGSMGVGILNVAAIHLSIVQGVTYALFFSFGCALTEAVFIRYITPLALYLGKKEKAQKIVEWGSIILLLLIGFSCVLQKNSSSNSPEDLQNLILIPGFFLGIFLRILNPTMIPFWIGWNALLIGQSIKVKALPLAIGGGIGTLIMHSIYIAMGQYAFVFLNENIEILTGFIGLVFIGTALLQIAKLIRNHNKAKEVVES